jgi:hypothetical protein
MNDPTSVYVIIIEDCSCKTYLKQEKIHKDVKL